MEPCRRELSIERCDLRSTSIAVAQENGMVVGVAQIKVIGSEADFLKLFVEPTALRSGIGRTLFAWATDLATSRGADRLVIDADPDAAPFCRRISAQDVGLASVRLNTEKDAAKVGQGPVFDMLSMHVAFCARAASLNRTELVRSAPVIQMSTCSACQAKVTSKPCCWSGPCIGGHR
jgi:Acetyltransferase (GNAT) domain